MFHVEHCFFSVPFFHMKKNTILHIERYYIEYTKSYYCGIILTVGEIKPTENTKPKPMEEKNNE